VVTALILAGVAGEGVPRPEQPNVGKLALEALKSGLSGHASQIGQDSFFDVASDGCRAVSTPAT